MHDSSLERKLNERFRI